jgi:diguanylate cyclase (GGDEF)-like protein
MQMQSDPKLCQAELNYGLKDLASRDLQLWSIGALVLTVVAIGFVATVLPNLVATSQFQIDNRFLPQLFTGFIVLIVLFNIYLLDQRRRLNTMRDAVMGKMLTNIHTENIDTQDPLTKLFNREHAKAVVAHEITRIDATGGQTTFIYFDIKGFRAINRRFGNLAGDHLLLVMAQILRSSFRGSDVICRYSGDEFLVILPDTPETNAGFAIRRVQAAIRNWNDSGAFSYKLAIDVSTGSYAEGTDVEQLFRCFTGRRNTQETEFETSSQSRLKMALQPGR